MAPRNKDENWLNTFTSATAKLHYRETPVSFREFISKEHFLGKLTRKGKAIYPVWQRELSFLMGEPSKYIPVFTGAIGTGKSRSSILGVAYVMYIHLCLKDPWSYYGLGAAGKMAVVFFNLNKSLGESKGYRILQNYLCNSEWFRQHGRISGSLEETIKFDLFDFVLASPFAQAELGQDVIAALMDEVDSPKAGMKHKEKVIASVESALRRFEDRFVKRGQTLGKFFIVASSQENLSFVNAFIAKKKQNKEVHIVDVPIWEAKEKDFEGMSKFPVQVGDMYSPSKILESDDGIRESLANGFKVIHVPEQFRRAFEEDIIGALRDLAGISATYLRKNKLFASEKYLFNCYDSKKEDPVNMMTIRLGVKEKDKDLMYYLDLDKIRTPKYIPRFIHGDIAFSGDAYGLAMAGIAGWKEIVSEREDGSFSVDKVPVVETDFILRIKAPENDEIDLSKIRKFIIELKKIHGFNVDTCTFDLKLASTDTTQILKKVGIGCEYMSIDKNSQFCRNFRDDLVKQERWICHRHEYLHFELTNLEEDPSTNKIDHPKEVVFMDPDTLKETVVEGSKDLSDAVIGSAIKALTECKVPPDIEVMRKVFNKGLEQNQRDPLWWVDKSSLRGPRRDKEEEAEQAVRDDFASRYADIWRRSQR